MTFAGSVVSSRPGVGCVCGTRPAEPVQLILSPLHPNTGTIFERTVIGRQGWGGKNNCKCSTLATYVCSIPIWLLLIPNNLTCTCTHKFIKPYLPGGWNDFSQFRKEISSTATTCSLEVEPLWVTLFMPLNQIWEKNKEGLDSLKTKGTSHCTALPVLQTSCMDICLKIHKIHVQTLSSPSCTP